MKAMLWKQGMVVQWDSDRMSGFVNLRDNTGFGKKLCVSIDGTGYKGLTKGDEVEVSEIHFNQRGHPYAKRARSIFPGQSWDASTYRTSTLTTHQQDDPDSDFDDYYEAGQEDGYETGYLEGLRIKQYIEQDIIECIVNNKQYRQYHYYYKYRFSYKPFPKIGISSDPDLDCGYIEGYVEGRKDGFRAGSGYSYEEYESLLNRAEAASKPFPQTLLKRTVLNIPSIGLLIVVGAIIAVWAVVWSIGWLIGFLILTSVPVTVACSCVCVCAGGVCVCKCICK